MTTIDPGDRWGLRGRVPLARALRRIPAIGAICREKGVIFHVDAAQATGRPDALLLQRPPAAAKDASTKPGKTPLQREIEKALSRVIRDPAVTVIVSGFQGTFGEQIRIVGEAARPQAVPYRQNMTVLDVMIQVGGMTDFADGNAAVLVRGAEGGKQYGIRLKDLLKRGDISANVGVRPGDIIIVPQSWF